jgi:hypothetical protein
MPHSSVMTVAADRGDPPVEDLVSIVLKWVLLAVALATFGVVAWALVVTYVFAAAAALMAWDFIGKVRQRTDAGGR